MKRLCSYASCDRSGTMPIFVNLGDARPSFCSMLHAAAYLVNRMHWAGDSTRDNPEQDELRSQAEAALAEIDRLRQLAKAAGA